MCIFRPNKNQFWPGMTFQNSRKSTFNENRVHEILDATQTSLLYPPFASDFVAFGSTLLSCLRGSLTVPFFPARQASITLGHLTTLGSIGAARSMADCSLELRFPKPNCKQFSSGSHLAVPEPYPSVLRRYPRVLHFPFRQLQIFKLFSARPSTNVCPKSSMYSTTLAPGTFLVIMSAGLLVPATFSTASSPLSTFS